jgi:hypothetical protein
MVKNPLLGRKGDYIFRFQILIAGEKTIGK